MPKNNRKKIYTLADLDKLTFKGKHEDSGARVDEVVYGIGRTGKMRGKTAK